MPTSQTKSYCFGCIVVDDQADDKDIIILPDRVIER
jgi:hypothetical protein